MAFVFASLLIIATLAVVSGVAVRTERTAAGVSPSFLDSFDALFLMFLIAAIALAGMWLSRFCSGFEGDAARVYLPTVALQFLTVGAVVLFSRHAGVRINFKPDFSALKSGVLYFVPTLSILLAGAGVALFYKAAFGEDIARQDAVSMFMELDGFFPRTLACLSIVLFAPIAEELFFRGLLYPVFKGAFLTVLCGGAPDSANALGRRTAAVAAAVSVSVLFSLIHASAYAALPIFLMGLILVCCYERTNSIVSPVITHSLFNLVNVAMLSAL